MRRQDSLSSTTSHVYSKPDRARRCWDRMAPARACYCASATASSGPPAGRYDGMIWTSTRRVAIKPWCFSVRCCCGAPWRQERLAIVHEALQRAGLSDVAGRSARLLSAGEQQRLALARAWVLKPHVLLLDEPTASLDPAATQAVEILLAQIAEGGTKIIMTTHDLGQARRLADEVLFLHRGRLLEHGPAAAFFSRPKSKEAAAFLDGQLVW
jgi:ABC-type sugar transport system ATPase subunit